MTLTVHFETQPDYCSVSRLQTWWTCKTTSMSLLNNLKLSLSSFSEKRLKLNVQISLNLSDCRVGLIRTMIPFVHISKDHSETQKYKHCCTQRMSSKLQTLSSEIAKPTIKNVGSRNCCPWKLHMLSCVEFYIIMHTFLFTAALALQSYLTNYTISGSMYIFCAVINA